MLTKAEDGASVPYTVTKRTKTWTFLQHWPWGKALHIVWGSKTAWGHQKDRLWGTHSHVLWERGKIGEFKILKNHSTAVPSTCTGCSCLPLPNGRTGPMIRSPAIDRLHLQNLSISCFKSIWAKLLHEILWDLIPVSLRNVWRRISTCLSWICHCSASFDHLGLLDYEARSLHHCYWSKRGSTSCCVTSQIKLPWDREYPDTCDQ